MQVSVTKPVFFPRADRVLRHGNLAASSSPDGVTLSSAAGRVEVVKRIPSSRGGWIELLRDNDPHFVQRNFHPRQVLRHPELKAAFGTDKPHSGSVLLHYAGDPPAGVEVKPTPVLLVHGASKNGDFWWDPQEDGSSQGLPQRLREQGFQVYAVTFAHNQDDNFLWAEQIHNASERIRTLTGAPRIDMVAHSKGGFAARMYCSNLKEDWMSEMGGEVRRLVLVGAPNGGIDYSFRHPSANYALYGDSDNPRLNAPISWEKMIAYGRRVDVSDVGFSSGGPDYWPGQRQMLARWDHEYGLSALEPDYHTTYEGGRGLVSEGRGIDHYIREGGNLVARLRDQGIDPSVEVAVLAGNKPNIPGIVNENAGPSDGLLLLASAVDLPDDTNLIACDVLPLHHKALVSDRQGQDRIAEILSQESARALTPEERDRRVEPCMVMPELPAAQEVPQTLSLL